MPLETPEEEAFRGISGQQYSAVDASNEGGDEIPTDPQDLTIYVQRVLEQMVRMCSVVGKWEQYT